VVVGLSREGLENNREWERVRRKAELGEHTGKVPWARVSGRRHLASHH
jgi:hypothetical protein